MRGIVGLLVVAALSGLWLYSERDGFPQEANGRPLPQSVPAAAAIVLR